MSKTFYNLIGHVYKYPFTYASYNIIIVLLSFIFFDNHNVVPTLIAVLVVVNSIVGYLVIKSGYHDYTEHYFGLVLEEHYLELSRHYDATCDNKGYCEERRRILDNYLDMLENKFPQGNGVYRNDFYFLSSLGRPICIPSNEICYRQLVAENKTVSGSYIRNRLGSIKDECLFSETFPILESDIVIHVTAYYDITYDRKRQVYASFTMIQHSTRATLVHRTYDMVNFDKSILKLIAKSIEESQVTDIDINKILTRIEIEIFPNG